MNKRNIADPARVKEDELKIKFSREQELEDLRGILNTVPGRRFIWRMLSLCGVFTLSFDNSGSLMSFNEGMRNIGLRLLDDINLAKDDALMVMMKEAKQGELNG